jgi:pilus assembly protein Flp/PilA
MNGDQRGGERTELTQSTRTGGGEKQMMINLVEMVRTFVTGLMKDEEGQAMVEYGLILALVSVVAITALQLLGTNVLGVFNSVAGSVGGAL